MFTGQILVYHYNGLHNSKTGSPRNVFNLKTPFNVKTKEEFQEEILRALDEVPPAKGYVMVKWNKRTFICEKDLNNPDTDYVRHEINWHPLLHSFTI